MFKNIDYYPIIGEEFDTYFLVNVVIIYREKKINYRTLKLEMIHLVIVFEQKTNDNNRKIIINYLLKAISYSLLNYNIENVSMLYYFIMHLDYNNF